MFNNRSVSVAKEITKLNEKVLEEILKILGEKLLIKK